MVLGAEGNGVGEVGAAALGPGSSVVELAPGVGAFAAGGGAGGVFESFGHPSATRRTVGSPGRGRGRRTWCRGRRGGCRRCRRGGGLLRRRGLVGVEVGCLHRAGQDGVVDGDDHGRSRLRVQVVRREVLEELGEREAAAVPPVEGTVCAAVGTWLRIRRGAVIASMTLPSIAAASAGMVKWPVVVPSPLSCRVSEHLARAACSSLRMSSFSWASTIFWSGSTASIARRAMRRSWSGLNRAAFSTSEASTVWRCSALAPAGS